MAKRKEKLVFNGTIFKVYQWRQKMFDGSYATFERMVRPGSVQIIAVVDGKIAIAQQSQPHMRNFLAPIGGRIDEGETPLQAAKREMMEESGMVARRWKLLRKVEGPSHKFWFGMYLFGAIDCRKVAPQKLDRGEKIKIKLISLKKMLNWRKGGARIGPDTALYFTELHYDTKKRKRFERMLGLSPKRR